MSEMALKILWIWMAILMLPKKLQMQITYKKCFLK
jgi:hypothetical protein